MNTFSCFPSGIVAPFVVEMGCFRDNEKNHMYRISLSMSKTVDAKNFDNRSKELEFDTNSAKTYYSSLSVDAILHYQQKNSGCKAGIRVCELFKLCHVQSSAKYRDAIISLKETSQIKFESMQCFLRGYLVFGKEQEEEEKQDGFGSMFGEQAEEEKEVVSNEITLFLDYPQATCYIEYDSNGSKEMLYFVGEEMKQHFMKVKQFCNVTIKTQ